MWLCVPRVEAFVIHWRVCAALRAVFFFRPVPGAKRAVYTGETIHGQGGRLETDLVEQPLRPRPKV